MYLRDCNRVMVNCLIFYFCCFAVSHVLSYARHCLMYIYSLHDCVLDVSVHASVGFGFLTFESEEGVDRVCNEHYIFINGKQVHACITISRV